MKKLLVVLLALIIVPAAFAADTELAEKAGRYPFTPI